MAIKSLQPVHRAQRLWFRGHGASVASWIQVAVDAQVVLLNTNKPFLLFFLGVSSGKQQGYPVTPLKTGIFTLLI
jgi:hypothetical protein